MEKDGTAASDSSTSNCTRSSGKRPALAGLAFSRIWAASREEPQESLMATTQPRVLAARLLLAQRVGQAERQGPVPCRRHKHYAQPVGVVL
eukprot:scaffold4145_cov115-Isochrysis_galbana.AAC.5